jgi:hypothetical protein
MIHVVWGVIGICLGALAHGAGWSFAARRLRDPRGAFTLALGVVGMYLGGFAAAAALGAPFATPGAITCSALCVSAAPWLTAYLRRHLQAIGQ